MRGRLRAGGLPTAAGEFPAPPPPRAPSPTQASLPTLAPHTPAPLSPTLGGSAGTQASGRPPSLGRPRLPVIFALIVSRSVWEVRPGSALPCAKFINRAELPDGRRLQPGEQVDWEQSNNRWRADNEFLDTY